MGERHLVYIRVDDRMYRDRSADELYYNDNVIGLHVQWLLGHNAVNCLVNMLDLHARNVTMVEGKPASISPFQVMASDFLYRADPHHHYTNAENVLQALYRACPITGFWESSSKILDKTRMFSPDNNTGITVVDFTDCMRPRYCFINPNTPFVTRNLKAFASCVPLDAATYVAAFGDAPKNWEPGHAARLIEKLSLVPLLTRDELIHIFLPKNRLASGVIGTVAAFSEGIGRP
jgi:hypothetical protein